MLCSWHCLVQRWCGRCGYALDMSHADVPQCMDSLAPPSSAGGGRSGGTRWSGAGVGGALDMSHAYVTPCMNSPNLLQAQEAAEAAAQDGAELVWEVWDVVDREFLDARNIGFDREAWASMRDAALASKPTFQHF